MKRPDKNYITKFEITLSKLRINNIAVDRLQEPFTIDILNMYPKIKGNYGKFDGNNDSEKTYFPIADFKREDLRKYNFKRKGLDRNKVEFYINEINAEYMKYNGHSATPQFTNMKFKIVPEGQIGHGKKCLPYLENNERYPYRSLMPLMNWTILDQIPSAPTYWAFGNVYNPREGLTPSELTFNTEQMSDVDMKSELYGTLYSGFLPCRDIAED